VESSHWLDKARQWRTFRRLHDQRPALPSNGQTFYEHILLFEPERFDNSVSSISWLGGLAPNASTQRGGYSTGTNAHATVNGYT
jgi:hypothetical protein